MRIFYYGVFDANGGLENFGRNLISKITSIDPEIKFTLLVENEDFSYKEQFLKIGCDYIVLPIKEKHTLKYYKTILNLFKTGNEKEDIIHLNICSFRNIPLIKAAKDSKLKTIIVGHYTKVDDGRVPLLHNIGRFFFSNYALNVTNSDDVTKFMFKKGSKTIFINNGIDVDKFAIDYNSRQEIRKKLNYSDSDIVIGQIGRISPEKNQIFSISVVQLLVSRFPNVKLCLVGKEMYPDPQSYAINNNLMNVVKFTGPVLSGIEKYYSAFDICLLPSKNEGLSLSLLESMANGVQSFYSTAVPQLSIKIKCATYLELNVDVWAKSLGDCIENKKYLAERKCELKSTDYELLNSAKRYVKLYKEYDEIKRGL